MRLSSSLTDSGVIGPVTRVYPDNEAHALQGPETPRRLRLLLAVLGTGLGTEQGEIDAHKGGVVKQAGRLNAADL
jgi:hypothetical protein